MVLPAITGGENGAGITCSIESAGTMEKPAESRSVNSRDIPNGNRHQHIVRPDAAESEAVWRLRREDGIGEVRVLRHSPRRTRSPPSMAAW